MIIITVLIALVVVVVLSVSTAADRAMLTGKDVTLTIDKKERWARTYQPTSEPKHIIVLLHGFQDRPAWISYYSGFANLAKQQNALLVAPAGIDQSWNGTVCCGNGVKNKPNDVAFVSKVVERLQNQHNISSNNTYMAGFSNGGLLVQKLANESSDLFGGGAVINSSVGANNQQLDIANATIPMFFSHGTADKYTPLKKGSTAAASFNFLSVETTKEAWSTHYECSDPQTSNIDDAKRTTYTCGVAPLQFRLYDGLPHRWPEARHRNPTTTIPPLTQDIWDWWQNT